MDGSRILIFMDTKKGCDQITRQLRMDGWPALSIHGDKSQAERDWVLSEFKAGKSPIMTATDVAARGLGMKLRLLMLIQRLHRNLFLVQEIALQLKLSTFFIFLFWKEFLPSFLSACLKHSSTSLAGLLC